MQQSPYTILRGPDNSGGMFYIIGCIGGRYMVQLSIDVALLQAEFHINLCTVLKSFSYLLTTVHKKFY